MGDLPKTANVDVFAVEVPMDYHFFDICPGERPGLCRDIVADVIKVRAGCVFVHQPVHIDKGDLVCRLAPSIVIERDVVSSGDDFRPVVDGREGVTAHSTVGGYASDDVRASSKDFAVLIRGDGEEIGSSKVYLEVAHFLKPQGGGVLAVLVFHTVEDIVDVSTDFRHMLGREKFLRAAKAADVGAEV